MGFQDCAQMGRTVHAHVYLLDLCHHDVCAHWVPTVIKGCELMLDRCHLVASRHWVPSVINADSSFYFRLPPSCADDLCFWYWGSRRFVHPSLHVGAALEP